MKVTVKIKDKYNSISTLDKALVYLERLAMEKGYDVDDNYIYIVCCTMLTDADFEGRKKIISTDFWKFYRIVEYEIKNYNRK